MSTVVRAKSWRVRSNNININKGGTSAHGNPIILHISYYNEVPGSMWACRRCHYAHSRRAGYPTLTTVHKPIVSRLQLATAAPLHYDGPSALRCFWQPRPNTLATKGNGFHTPVVNAFSQEQNKKRHPTNLKQGPRVQLLETAGVGRRQLPSQSADRAQVLKDVIPERHVLPIAFVLPTGTHIHIETATGE